jgi:hypothetical protein
MQVIEIEPMNEKETGSTTTAREKCYFAERVLFWFIVLLSALIITLFCIEVLELMHLRNSMLKYELQKIIQVHNEHLRRYKPLAWMP